MLVQSFSHGDSALLAALLATGLLLLTVSQFVRIPYPIVLVVGGVLIGFMPGMPEVQLNPDLVLVAVLPPLLYGGAFFTSLRELRANMKAICFLAVGLVLVTMVAVAAVAHEFIDGLELARGVRARCDRRRRPIRPPRARSPSGSGCPRGWSR